MNALPFDDVCLKNKTNVQAHKKMKITITILAVLLTLLDNKQMIPSKLNAINPVRDLDKMTNTQPANIAQ